MMSTKECGCIRAEQKTICVKHDAEYWPIDFSSKIGISNDALKGLLPIHGLRHAPEHGVSGWYIWSGEYSSSTDFFKPLHVEHAISEKMVFARYLGLSPGWRFLIGENGYEDVWFDSDLLDHLQFKARGPD